MRVGTSRAARDQGESLIELILAVAIMGIAVVSIVSGLGTSILMSDIHRKQATAGAYVRDYAEAVQSYVGGTGYTACAAPASYSASNVGFTGTPSGYAASPISLQYWTGTAWSVSPCSADTGLQRLTVQVASSTNARASEQTVVILRKPCGPTLPDGSVRPTC